MLQRASLFFFLLASLGCGGDDGPRPTDGDADSDSDTDADVDADADTDSDTDCASGETRCGADCADLDADEAHCGACDQPCEDGMTCEDGACLCEGVTCRPGDSCVDGECDCAAPGRVDCGDVCTDLGSDPANCRECGHVCPTGGLCDAGDCVCPAGEINCETACVDTTTDELNCGECGEICAGSCESGVCECGDLYACGTTPDVVCTDLDVDPRNCGNCGWDCQFWGYCRDGECECRPSLTACTYTEGTFCQDLETDPFSCGTCGFWCGTDEVCSEGECITACPDESDACDTAGGGNEDPDYCTDFDSDPYNCGGCWQGAISYLGYDAICLTDEVCSDGVCTRWFPAYGCTSCGDCDACPDGSVCCSYPGEPTQAICLLADACPS